jgi:predicted outer membrane repeat protein
MKRRFLLIAALLAVISGTAIADTLNVPADYPSIQAAIHAAVDGDMVLVAPGTYFENINFYGKSIVVTGKEGAASTMIDGGDAGRVVTFRSGEGPDSVLRGFTITNGRAYRGGGILCRSAAPTIADSIIHDNQAIDCGGGMYCNEGAAPFIDHCAITGNEALEGGVGGGLCCDRSSPIIMDTLISKNNAAHGGGGLYCTHASPSLLDTVVRDNWTYWNGKGGGMFCSYGDPRLTECNFISNQSDGHGGGLYLQGGCVGMKDCIFHDNYASGGDGGGLYAQGGIARLVDCAFLKNSASYIISSGGALVNHSGKVTLIGCSFSENLNAGGDGYGAAIFNQLGELHMSQCVVEKSTMHYGCEGGGLANRNGEVTLTDCRFLRNSVVNALMSDSGGAIYNWEGSLFAARCFFIQNEAGESGGAVAGYFSVMEFRDCVFTENQAYMGGGIFCLDSEATMTGCTQIRNRGFYNGSGGGIHCREGSSLTIANSILWDNQAETGPEIMVGDAAEPSSLTISHSDIKRGQSSVFVDSGCALAWGPGMIDSDPLFADLAGGDIHLTFNSPCRGSGDNSAPGLSDIDFEGDPRIAQGTVDMGADEFHAHLYYTGDAKPGGEVRGKLVGLPGTAPVGLLFGSGLLEQPSMTPWGTFHLEAPWMMFLLDPMPPEGILVIRKTIPVTSPVPLDLPMQALIGSSADALTNPCVLQISE